MLSDLRPQRAGWPRWAGAADQAGSGTAIGVAIIFPVLMLVIVGLAGLTRSSRTEQVLQAAADRAALTAAVCCFHVGGQGGAMQTVRANLAATSRDWRHSDVECINDVAADSRVAFSDVADRELLIDPGAGNGGWSDPDDLYMRDSLGNIVTRDVDDDPDVFNRDFAVIQEAGTPTEAQLDVRGDPYAGTGRYRTGIFEPQIDPNTGRPLINPLTGEVWLSLIRNGPELPLDAAEYPGVGERAEVPPGGLVRVLVECRMPPEVLGDVGLPGIDVTHRAVGVATVDPYRHRFNPVGSP